MSTIYLPVCACILYQLSIAEQQTIPKLSGLQQQYFSQFCESPGWFFCCCLWIHSAGGAAQGRSCLSTCFFILGCFSALWSQVSKEARPSGISTQQASACATFVIVTLTKANPMESQCQSGYTGKMMPGDMIDQEPFL